MNYERTCEFCGKTFMAKTLYSKYCCHNCSKKAYARKQREELLEKARLERVEQTTSYRNYITVKEAVDLFALSKHTIYRLVRKGIVNSIQLGERSMRVCKEDFIEHSILPQYENINTVKEKQNERRLYSYYFDETDCYTVGEINKKYAVHDTTIWAAIRKNGIPTVFRKNYVYVPKDLIDELFGNAK